MNWFAANIVLVQGTFITFLLALSMQFPFRVGVFSFAGIGFYGIGAYATGILVTRFDVPHAAALILGTVLAGTLGYVLGLILQRLNGLYLAMGTLSLILIVVVVVSNGGSFTGGHTGLYGALGGVQTWHLAVIALAAIAVFASTERGSTARRIDAVREDPALAASMGIRVGRYRRTAFLVSGILGGLAGGLQVLVRGTIQPEGIGFALVVTVLTVVIVGGSGSWAGALIGAVIFTWLPAMLSIAGGWRGVVYGLIVVLAAVFFPGGIWGLVRRAQAAIRQRRDGADEPGGDPAGPADPPREPVAPAAERGGAR